MAKRYFLCHFILINSKLKGGTFKLKKELYCQLCDEDVEVSYKKEKVNHRINNEDIEVEIQVPYCNKCGQELSDLDLEEERYELVYSKYRQMKKLLHPTAIKEVREKYHLSQRAFSRVLGFSESTINRYELGALQDNIHNTILVLANDPKNMQLLMEQNNSNLSEVEQTTLKATLNELIDEDNKSCKTDLDSVLERISKNVSMLQNNVNKVERRLEQVDKKIDNFSNEFRRKDVSNKDVWPIENILKTHNPVSKFDSILSRNN